MEDFKNLKVWSKAHELTLMIYQSDANLSQEKRFTDSQARCGERRPRSARTSLRAAADDRIVRWRGFFRSLAGRPVNSNIICCLRDDLHLLRPRSSRDFESKS